MRLAVIADIHGNLTALDAVLAAIQADQIDQMVCLGDVAATGPQPRQTVERLRALGCPMVLGNADAWLLQPLTLVRSADEDARRIEEIDRWCAGRLSGDDLAYLRTFQPTIEAALSEGATLLCFHGSPRGNTEIIVATTPDAKLDEILVGHQALVLAGGHTHAQMLRRVGRSILINPGSVGLPYEGERNPPWAEYAVVEYRDGALSIELRRVAIDAGAVARAALESGMPHAEWWASGWR